MVKSKIMRGSAQHICWINLWIYGCFLGKHTTYAANEDFELTPQDGWFNNLIHPDWGAIDGQLLRKSKVAYSDGVYMPSGKDRPNPFEISYAGHHGPPGLGSMRNRSAFMVFFGQQVVEEILDAQRPGCPREFFNIHFPPDNNRKPNYDPDGKGNIELPVFRSRYDQRTGYSPNNPRQQLNEITPFIDGTLMYGVGKAWTDAIRELSEEKPGRLKAQDPSSPISQSFPADNDIKLPMANPAPPREHELKPVARFWRLGNPRGNENPFLLAFGVLWFRYHNYVADQIHKQHGGLNDEQVFNIARKKVIAVHQKIVMYDWLPNWLRLEKDGTPFKMPAYDKPDEREILEEKDFFFTDPYKGYDPNVHPGISQEFQAAAFRFGHTLVTPGTWIRDKQCNFKLLPIKIPGGSGNSHAVRLCNAYWNPQEFLNSSPEAFENMLMGLATTRVEREDHIVVPDLREHLFGPLEFSRRDLVAINIQRARDHGLPDYNSVREAYGLERKASWEDINTYVVDSTDFPDNESESLYNYTNNYYMQEPIQRVKLLYGNTSAPDNLDLFSGGILETTPDGPGELFRTIILDQFLRIRHGDRFWFENRDNGLFDNATIDEIWNTTILDIVLAITNISANDINANPFFINGSSDQCFQPEQLRADTSDQLDGVPVLEKCTPLQHYDYFSGSEASFALSFLALGLCIPGTIGIMILMAKMKERKLMAARRQQAPRRKDEDPNTYLAVEWVGFKDGERNIKVKFDKDRKKIHVTDRGKRPLRMIDLRFTDKVNFRLSEDKGCTVISVRVPGEIDLVLRFADQVARSEFVTALETFLREMHVERQTLNFKEIMILKDATTKEIRKKLLDQFIRVVCLQAYKREDAETPNFDADTANSVSKIQLTRTEFADALGLKPTSMFVRNMFLMVDKDRNGFVSFQEFMEVFTILAKGGAGDKAEMLFHMHDLRGKGELTQEGFTKMIKSMLDLSDSSLDSSDVATLVSTLYQQAGLRSGQNMTLAAFKKIFASEEYEQTLENATLQLQGAKTQWQGKQSITESFSIRRKTFIQSYEQDATANGHATLDRRHSKIRVQTKTKDLPMTGWQKRLYSFNKYVENYKRQIFWVTLYIFISIGIFVERAYYYSFEREHVGLRRIAGYGVTVTRGAASGMMWTYSCLLITMSRNTITFLRETFLHRFIPFDSLHAMHKFVAALALVFTVTHCVGHGINLYHISTWPSNDLNCVFREYFRSTDKLASFHYWAWTTITGITGIVLTVIVIVMYVFAMPYARRHLFSAFWFTHSFYIFLYIFLILHGSGRLVQAPLTQNYLIGPLVIYVFDKLISFSRKKVEISVQKAELLPSDVLGLTFKRPLNFEYKSGQWVRIACIELGEGEYHPFTLTSAPHEEHLSLHIRAVGPWTMNMRKTYDINNRDGKPFPKLYLDGPFGEGHQDWYRYKVAVLVGGGIGVTPFASILKDIVFKSKTENVRFPCEKVYFIWVTRTQKQFEWLTDIIREVEENDHHRLVNVHIFITQFQQKFDLRTTMLYICERNFQKVCGKSLFTGLRATTHFGRPQFEEFFKSLHHEHPSVKQVGVFSCGPPPMTLNVDRACSAMNKYDDFPTYSHHFENF
ncbi:dual oxidase 2-like [Mercenaria mercenaria]|uniref:dual oxidase 2-like n=1 Tax=Mercenaria mercenaria TaxID=6596 RepID=UPI00234FB0BB|nr:dual oxidase 2-like [Mercenaria mercenaria]